MLRRCVFFMILLSVGFARTPRPLADIPIQTPDRKGINLKKFRGKVVLLAIISSECDACIKTLDLMTRLEKSYGQRGFQAVAALGDENAPFLLNPFIQRYRPSYPVGFLTKDQIIKITDIPPDMRPYVPISLFIDPEGVVRYQFLGNEGFYQDQEKGSRAVIETMLQRAAGKKAAPPDSK
jgi:thiol-disulfide isomerase/thioredoxin